MAGEGVVEVRGSTVGASVNEQGSSTAYLQEGLATFNGYALHNNEACTLDPAGAFECANQGTNNIWSVLSEGVVNGAPPKDGDLSNTTKSDDQKDKKDTETLATPTPTSTLTPTPTLTPTSTPEPDEKPERGDQQNGQP